MLRARPKPSGKNPKGITGRPWSNQTDQLLNRFWIGSTGWWVLQERDTWNMLKWNKWNKWKVVVLRDRNRGLSPSASSKHLSSALLWRRAAMWGHPRTCIRCPNKWRTSVWWPAATHVMQRPGIIGTYRYSRVQTCTNIPYQHRPLKQQPSVLRKSSSICFFFLPSLAALTSLSSNAIDCDK